MNDKFQKDFFYCNPGEKLSAKIIDKLKQINANKKKDNDFPKYLEAIRELFNLSPVAKTTESLFFLGGFIEGEGSTSVSAKITDRSPFGIDLDPEFSITQHVNGVRDLYLALVVFQTGRLSYKDDSNATMKITIDNRKSLVEKVVPFYEKYIVPIGSTYKVYRFNQFKELLGLFDQKCHLNLDCFTNEMLPIWDDMRMQKGQINESFPDLEAAQDYARKFKKK